MPYPLEAVIFDLDDTLFPERQYAFSGFAAVAVAFASVCGDPSQTTARLRRLFDTPHRPRVFNALLIETGHTVDDNLIADMVTVYRGHAPSIALYPDASAALSRLRPQFKLGVISDGHAASQRAKVAALGLARRIDEILLTADLGAGFGKPHARAFELMTARLGVDPCRCAYVADNAEKDFVAPNKLGWTSVQIQRPDGIYLGCAPPTGGEPRLRIDRLEQLDSILSPP